METENPHCLSVGNELRCILDWKKTLLQTFEDKNYNKLVEILMQEAEVKAVEKSLSNKRSLSPFSSLYLGGKRQVKELKDSRVSITLYGKRGAGKNN